MSQQEKVRENRLRRLAKRRGLVLHKVARRDPDAPDYGQWWVFTEHEEFVELDSGETVHVNNGLGFPNVEELEAFLTQPQPRMWSKVSA